MKRSVMALAVLFAAMACSHKLAPAVSNPYQSTNDAYRRQASALTAPLDGEAPDYFPAQGMPWVGTTNFDLRKPNFVIVHHTAQAACPLTLKAFTTPSSKVSAHYVICKDGTVYHMLNDYLRAWQAGLSQWGSASDINSLSIGIELDNDGFEYFPDAQIHSLLTLLDTLKTHYGIPTANFIGHADIAPGRKNDPNWRFPWRTLAEHGYGNWFADTANLAVPANFDGVTALRLIGYNTRDTAAAVASFRRHWMQDTSSVLIDTPALKILYKLSR